MANLLDAAFAQLPGSSSRQQMAENGDTPGADDEDDDAKPEPEVRKVMAAMVQNHKPSAKAKRVAKKTGDDSVGDADDEDWGVQLGNFSSRDKAVGVAKATFARLAQTASDGDPKAVADKHHRWHARIVGLSSNQAHQSCHRLTRLHKPCRVVEEASDWTLSPASRARVVYDAK